MLLSVSVFMWRVLCLSFDLFEYVEVFLIWASFEVTARYPRKCFTRSQHSSNETLAEANVSNSEMKATLMVIL